ncbi:formyltransferase family protein [Pseudomonas nitroreducens]|uniref:formyltransferase family protein n=1 Tax=Pseudomonas nitroreducens TaxID=46680 RepID=UPI003FA743CA
MRIVIIGQKWLAAQLLRQCVDGGHQVLTVVCPAGDSVAAVAASAGVPVCEEGRCVQARQVPCCDLILVAHAHAYIQRGARNKARLGALGYHPSLLPLHRGRNAIQSCLAMGDELAGGSLYWLDNGYDTGRVVAQDSCPVRPGDTPESLWRRDLAPMGLRLFAGVLARLSQGEHCPGWPQDLGLVEG